MHSENAPDISVIIPIYNVEKYIAACLNSVLNQTKNNLEVIMIDDGSTDKSGEIAREYAEKYDHFYYERIENSGLGHARNYAVTMANGKYIAFVDSDDIVVQDAYEKMFCAAEKNGSDLTICNVARFNSKKSWQSSLHKKVFTDTESVTHITKKPNLLYDTTSWNKLILHSFYLNHNFQFPENILYEDIPVTIPMHYFANNVSVVNSVGYLWRVRDGVSKSITQNASDMTNLNDRITVMKMLDEFFDKNVSEENLKKLQKAKHLEIDLSIFIYQCVKVSVERAEKILSIIRDYINSSVDESVFESLAIINQQKYRYIMDNNLNALIKLLDYEKNGYYAAPVNEKDSEFYIDLPDDLFTINKRNVTDDLRNIEPNNAIDNVIVKGGSISIYAHIFQSRLNISNFEEQSIKAYLYNDITNEKYPLSVKRGRYRDLTADWGYYIDKTTKKVSKYNYDGVGYMITINNNIINAVKEKYQGTNRIYIEYENRLKKGSLFLNSVSYDVKRKSKNKTFFVDRTRVVPKYSYLDEFQLFINNEEVFAVDISFKDNMLSCVLDAPANSIFAKENNSDNQIEFKRNDETHFSTDCTAFENGINYSLYIEKLNGDTDRLLHQKKYSQVISLPSRVSFVQTTRTNFVLLRFEERASVLKRVAEKYNFVAMETVAEGSTEEIAKAKKAYICVDDAITKEKVILAKSICSHKRGKAICRFIINFNSKKINRNFYNGYRDVYIEYILPDGSVSRDMIYREKHFNIKMKIDDTLELEFYRFVTGTVKLRLKSVWREDENTLSKRQELTFKNYPKYREEPINEKQIVFESMWGSKYSCNPQALYEYIDKNYPEYQCIWSLTDERTPVKGRGIRVRRGSQEYYHYLATAKYFVNNVNFEDGYVKRDGQIEIQTMHGTPLKTLGLDVEGDFPTDYMKELYIKKNLRWNYLIVQGKFMEDKAYSCFKCDCEILRTGYPRTDKLFDSSAQKINKIKENLGIPFNKKIVLYTPTWRVKNNFDMQLDLDMMRQKLSEEYVILVRLHHFCSKGYKIPADNEFIFDMNNYRYVEDLYRIADILITDYSSVMFDFALLNKPMLFFAYDIDEYCNNLRGLYVDFKKEAPGPILYDTDEVIDSILNIDEETEKCKDRIKAFHEKYLTYESADSCEQIVRKVLKSK